MEPQQRRLPAVGTLINTEEFQKLSQQFGREPVVYSLRRVIETEKKSLSSSKIPDATHLAAQTKKLLNEISKSSLRPLVNATGIILHTNLGRAPLGDMVTQELLPVVSGYSNIEFNLGAGCRGHRMEHIAELLGYLTGAEENLVVNNNAAAILLALHTLAKRREVIVSRGELIEIGGSFRIPDIMSVSGAKMVEVGTTNKTRLSDYESAITNSTALIFKAHRSNFSMAGFVEEVSISELARFCQDKKIPFLYDLGSGLLRKPANIPLDNEPDVRSVIECGVDMVAFSGDKLLGGPQAGILSGKSEYIRRCSKNPFTRALRVGKLTLAALSASCRTYLSDETLLRDNPTFSMLNQPQETIRNRAENLISLLSEKGIQADLLQGTAQVGGGTLPDLHLKSSAVALRLPANSSSGRKNKTLAERLFAALMRRQIPIVGVLREGLLMFELFTVSNKELALIVEGVYELLYGEDAHKINISSVKE